MKLVCINNDHWSDGHFDNINKITLRLTVGKIYDVYEKSDSRYIILDNLGDRISLDPKRFISMSEYRKIQLDKIIK